MQVTNAIMTEKDIEESEVARSEYRIKSQMKCMKATKGIRPREFSVLLGPSGNGKSTFCRTISLECALSSVRVLHILSEEKSSVYKAPISKQIKQMTKSGTEEKFMDNLFFVSMLDWKAEDKTPEMFFSNLEQIVNDYAPELIIFDNFTTSFFNDIHVSAQGAVIDKFRKFADVYDIAILGVFHTVKGTDIYKKLITGEDVRGNSTATNGSSYVYTIQNFFKAKPKIASILTIEKARYHSEFNQTYWELEYNKEIGLYYGDKQVEYDRVVEIQKSCQQKMSKRKDSKEWLN